jgi:hypothetical protein
VARKKKQPGPGEEGYQETTLVNSPEDLGQLLLGKGMQLSPFVSPNAPEPSYSKRPTIIFLYICPQCGWWDISTGVDEIFGSFVRKAGPRTEPCERCQHSPMYLVKRHDLLRTFLEAEKMNNGTDHS